MTSIQIKKLSNPTLEVRKAILSPLNNFVEHHGFKWEKLSFTIALIHDGEVKGGLVGELHWGWLYIQILSVHTDLRGKGYGRSLMQSAEQYAKKEGCRGAWVNTFSFQAPKFYENLGYQEFGRISEYPEGNDRLFYQKAFK